jgi:hypothetical protein
MTVYLVLNEKYKQKPESSILGLFQMSSARLRFIKQDRVLILLYDAANAAQHTREVATPLTLTVVYEANSHSMQAQMSKVSVPRDTSEVWALDR